MGESDEIIYEKIYHMYSNVDIENNKNEQDITALYKDIAIGTLLEIIGITFALTYSPETSQLYKMLEGMTSFGLTMFPIFRIKDALSKLEEYKK